MNGRSKSVCISEIVYINCGAPSLNVSQTGICTFCLESLRLIGHSEHACVCCFCSVCIHQPFISFFLCSKFFVITKRFFFDLAFRPKLYVFVQICQSDPIHMWMLGSAGCMCSGYDVRATNTDNKSMRSEHRFVRNTRPIKRKNRANEIAY